MSKNRNQSKVTDIKDGEFTEAPKTEDAPEQDEVKRDFIERVYDRHCERKQKKADKKAEREQKGGLSTKAKWAIGLGVGGSVALGIVKTLVNHAAAAAEDVDEADEYVPQELGTGSDVPETESNNSDVEG